MSWYFYYYSSLSLGCSLIHISNLNKPTYKHVFQISYSSNNIHTPQIAKGIRQKQREE